MTSPILFNIYLDDLITLLTNDCVKVLAFADDFVVTVKGKFRKVESVMRKINEWSLKNKIDIIKTSQL